jgi:hypothetical protein
MRLEVNETNAPAIALYRKAGYECFARVPAYYEDGGNALRFEKNLLPPGARTAPPYFHQSTEFTCGSACMMMALAWADPAFRPDPTIEFRLWREATTIFMSSGPGGCGPHGIAVALKRRGLQPEIHVSEPGPYFLDTVRSAEKRRVMRITHDEFIRESGEIGIVTRLTPLDESALINALDNDGAAILLVSGYRMVRRGVPHWIFAFGREGRHILVHDPAARRDERGRAISTATYAVPWARLDTMMRYGRNELRASVLLQKGKRPV